MSQNPNFIPDFPHEFILECKMLMSSADFDWWFGSTKAMPLIGYIKYQGVFEAYPDMAFINYQGDRYLAVFQGLEIDDASIGSILSVFYIRDLTVRELELIKEGSVFTTSSYNRILLRTDAYSLAW